MKFASTKNSCQLMALCVAMVALSACNSAQAVAAPVTSVQTTDEQSVRAQLLIGTPWKIAKVGDRANFADGVATLSTTREGRLSAFAGCNGMGAEFTYADGVLKVGSMMATQMACEPAKKMDDEQALGEALSNQTLKVVESSKGATLTNDVGTVIELVPVAE